MATFASIKALRAVIEDALDDIERIFVSHQQPLQSQTGFGSTGDDQNSSPRVSEVQELGRAPLDFPSPDKPYDPLSPAEALVSHPTVARAIRLITSATGQLAATVQSPAFTIAEATAGVSDHIYYLCHLE